MDLFSAMKISSSALNAQRIRMNLIASNLANVNTSRTPEGGPYRKKSAVFASAPIFKDLLNSEMSENAKGVQVVQIVEDQQQPKMVYEPSHPDADQNGFVSYPNINVMKEMVNMLSATRSYEANITVMNALKSMAVKALELTR